MFGVILIIIITRGQTALQGDWRTVFAELASHQFHPGCAIGTAISQRQTAEYNHDDDEYCNGDSGETHVIHIHIHTISTH